MVLVRVIKDQTQVCGFCVVTSGSDLYLIPSFASRGREEKNLPFLGLASLNSYQWQEWCLGESSSEPKRDISYSRVCACTHACVYMHVCRCVCVCVQVLVDMWIHVHMCVYMYVKVR